MSLHTNFLVLFIIFLSSLSLPDSLPLSHSAIQFSLFFPPSCLSSFFPLLFKNRFYPSLLHLCLSLGYRLVQFCHSVTSDSLQPHGLQHTRLPCPSPTPGAYSSSCPLSQWYHPTIVSSCHPLLLLPSIFPGIRVFSNEYSELISFRIDWFDLLTVQGTLEKLVVH